MTHLGDSPSIIFLDDSRGIPGELARAAQSRAPVGRQWCCYEVVRPTLSQMVQAVRELVEGPDLKAAPPLIFAVDGRIIDSDDWPIWTRALPAIVKQSGVFFGFLAPYTKVFADDWSEAQRREARTKRAALDLWFESELKRHQGTDDLWPGLTGQSRLWPTPGDMNSRRLFENFGTWANEAADRTGKSLG